jgi:hypothetical protein
MFLIFSFKNGPKWSLPPNPTPSPSLASAEVSCQGAEKIENNTCLMIFYNCYEKRQTQSLPGGFYKGSLDKKYLKIMKTIAAVFPRGSKKRKSNNDDKHGHGKEKRRPSTLC